MEASINADFAAILEASGVDYRVIVAGDYPPGEQLDIWCDVGFDPAG